MSVVEVILLVLAIFFVLGTAASATSFDNWWVRIFDFPRFQIACILLVLIALFSWVFQMAESWHWVLVICMFVCLVYQSVMIFPYTRISKKQVQRVDPEDQRKALSVIASNVLGTNRQAEKLLALVHQFQPDILLTLESDKWWEKQLAVLEDDYCETVKIPLDNLYGMHLYSKLRLHDVSVNFLLEKDIPSIEAYVELRSGERVKIYCLHPKPPVPSQGDKSSTKRDAELLIVGKKIEERDEAVMVFGDLNDVAWSHTTKLFQKISNLLDPRVGRGFFSTFHASYPIFRWPLDHIFHSNEFLLNDIRVLSNIGSDHFPIYFSLCYDPRNGTVQEEPDADEEEEEESEEKIRKARFGGE